MCSLNEFWEEIAKIEDNKLKIAVQKRFLIDSTWAFHEAVRSGKKRLIDFFLSKLKDLPKEEILGHASYKYNLLRGIDLVDPKKKNLITNAVISRNIDVLEMMFNNIKELIEELEDIVKRNSSRHEALQDVKKKLVALRQDYYLKDSFAVPDLVIALHLAARVSDERMVNALLEAVKDKFGVLALINLLLAVDENRKTVMHWVASVGDVNLLKILLRTAGSFGLQNLIDLLLARDEKGKTALHLSVFFGHREVLASLLKEAARINILKRLLLTYDHSGESLCS